MSQSTVLTLKKLANMPTLCVMHEPRQKTERDPAAAFVPEKIRPKRRTHGAGKSLIPSSMQEDRCCRPTNHILVEIEN